MSAGVYHFYAALGLRMVSDGYWLNGIAYIVFAFSFGSLQLLYHRSVFESKKPTCALERIDYGSDDQLGTGLIVLPTKVHVGNSYSIQAAFGSTAETRTNDDKTQLLAKELRDSSEYYTIELQTAGFDIDNQRRKRIISRGGNAIWNCHFSKAGNYTINVYLSKVYPQFNLQDVIFFREHPLQVITLYSLLGSLLASILSILFSGIGVSILSGSMTSLHVGL